MGTTTEKLTYLQETKDAIKNAIVAKGVEVPEGTTFREYAEIINLILSNKKIQANVSNESGNIIYIKDQKVLEEYLVSCTERGYIEIDIPSIFILYGNYRGTFPPDVKGNVNLVKNFSISIDESATCYYATGEFSIERI